ncbi:MAG: hypothetical protein WBM50_03755 [Acidimicrobiales bacterium]
MALLMRPGTTLLLAGILSFLVSRYIDIVPLIGSMLAVMLFLFSVFAMIGGVWLVVAERRTARA